MQTRLDPTTADRNAAVLAAARAGDRAAWEEIVHRYDGAVRAAIATYRPHPVDAADAVQNTWLRLFEHAATIRDPEKLGGWLATTARRECLALLRRQRIERPIGAIDIGQPSPEPTPEAMAILAETHRQVRLATEALPTRPRELIDGLYYRTGGSYAEVARHLGLPIGSIGPTRRRTLHSLRQHLTGTGRLA